MKDQPSNSDDDKKEPPRPRTIPDDFIWDEELQAWYPPGEPSTFDAEAWQREFDEMRRRGDFDGAGLFSVDDLRAAGALNVPPRGESHSAARSAGFFSQALTMTTN